MRGLRTLLHRLLRRGDATRVAVGASGGPALTLGDDEPVKVILGLGNPGKEYERTRHNVGWWVLDHLAETWRFESWKKDGDAKAVTGLVGPYKVRLIKPQTYYNLSGNVLRPFLKRPFWSAKTDLLVICDDVALPVGSIRLRAKGSAGGSNGLKSVEGVLRSQEYPRLRVGTKPADERREIGNLADFVLSEFGKIESQEVRALFPTITDAAELWLREGIEPAMNRFNATAKGG